MSTAMSEREKGVCFVVVERVEEVVFPREGTEEKLIVRLFSPSCSTILYFYSSLHLMASGEWNMRV